MIEIEKKFILTADEQERLLSGALFVSQKTFTDVYYDTEEYVLAQKDWWLRLREGRGELKIPSRMQSEHSLDQYEEVTDENDIARHFAIRPEKDLMTTLLKLGYIPVCTITTHRTTYKDGDFRIDIDSATYDDGFTYSIAEIELLVETPEAGLVAAQRIIEYACAKGLRHRPVRGKMLTHLFRKRPEIYRLLCTQYGLKEAEV